MADEDPPQHGAAAFLAGWTKLDEKNVESCYRSVYPAGQARSWPELVARPGAGIIAEACREASEKAFLGRLAEMVAKWERDGGRKQEEINIMLAKTAGDGEMQAIMNQLAGLLDESVIYSTADALRACAIVLNGTEQRGTAFLVRPDMVLTAAHVVFAGDGPAGEETWAKPPRLLDDLEFSFRALDSRPATERFIVRPAPKGALRASSSPYGRWPNILASDLQLPPPDQPSLDYALIRLAKRVEHVRPILVDPPKAVMVKRRCWVIGFPGGTALKCGEDDVVSEQPGGGRWLHLANAAPGMSGGCCINRLGELAGLHEGSVEVDIGAGLRTYNRGIGIRAVRADMTAGRRDPLAMQSATPGVEFDDPELVGELYRAGMRLAGGTAGAVWDQSVRSVLGVDPTDTAALPSFHPWFQRAEFEFWIDAAKPRERLCIISGDRGAGASFCKQILRAKADPAGLGYLEISATQFAAMTPTETVGIASSPSPSRTTAANFRYNDANAVVEKLRARSDEGSRQSYVAIDFGPDGGRDRLIGSDWQQFVVRLLAEDWIRVVLIGLRVAEQDLLREVLASRSETDSLRAKAIAITPVAQQDLLDYASDLAGVRGASLSLATIAALVGAILGPTPEAVPPALQTVSFALAAMAFEKGLP